MLRRSLDQHIPEPPSFLRLGTVVSTTCGLRRAGAALATHLPSRSISPAPQIKRANAQVLAGHGLQRFLRGLARKRHLGLTRELAQRLLGLVAPVTVDGTGVAADPFQFRVCRARASARGSLLTATGPGTGALGGVRPVDPYPPGGGSAASLCRLPPLTRPPVRQTFPGEAIEIGPQDGRVFAVFDRIP